MTEPDLTDVMHTATGLPERGTAHKVEILRLEPGDVLAVKSDVRLTSAAAEEIKAQVKEKFPDHEVFLYSGMDLAVVRPCPVQQPPDQAE